ncbi:YbhB/YbcL family Raf kinase inhibitor-like protein [Piscinibacter koreensis]|uniref:YbhB/YbcL family Raf kinase inhibitor-like protein n=1 Tax=Piscinibacter koreensis TaxID=2742824 RepID=A0A7Y6NKN4_9BURK|nr:YbhB/YbcL family Raf kinase inhibitor-like protein [Schlegelella koreensis]NUZ04859.1 YbhB/YbcL family Raf kinase inhibitor-like protein [Schlegelella koreensis]
MRLWSRNWTDGEPLPERHAAGRIDPAGGVTFADDVNPHLAWDGVPPGTRSLVLTCHDVDVPSSGEDVNQSDREVPASLPRVDFFHWSLVDIDPTRSDVDEGSFSSGFITRGKPGPRVEIPGWQGTRQGLNDFTGWFAGDEAMKGEYFGYDGPFPPFNDSLIHHYVFTLYALDVERAPVDGSFGGAELRDAIRPHVLASATIVGTYTLNRRLLAR